MYSNRLQIHNNSTRPMHMNVYCVYSIMDTGSMYIWVCRPVCCVIATYLLPICIGRPWERNMYVYI